MQNFPYTRSIQATRRYLYIPVCSANPKVVIQILHEGALLREFDVQLALDDPVDWWAFYDISAFSGQALDVAIVAGEVSASAAAWLNTAIRQENDFPPMPGLYAERYRPQLHFTPMRGWNNDPNGMVFLDGVWHLYYQHNPFGTRWGNMHWGHAISRDLVHWEELPEALYQRSLNDMAFSGGGLVDENNTAGFQQGAKPALVVAFTSTGRGECLAYSNDGGLTLTEWEGNPFLTHQGRDPKIIWLQESQRWAMIIYEELQGWETDPSARGYAFYDSPDLKRWTRRSFLPGYFECPELFRLPIEDNPEDWRWVVHGCTWEQARSAALIGSFDGHTFTGEEENHVAHAGPHFYAAQVFSSAPDGRVILIGWLAGADFPEMPFSQGMTVPLELSLRRTPGGLRLCFFPVKELEALHEASFQASALSQAQANAFLAEHDSELLDIELSLRADAPFSIDIRGHMLTWNPGQRTLTFAGASASISVGEERLALRLLIDRSVTEVFANQGLAAFSAMTIFADPGWPVQIEGIEKIEAIQVWRMRSIWK